MNVDKRGFKRGRCLASTCDCEMYECPSEGVRCVYCECPPPKHEKLDGASNCPIPASGREVINLPNRVENAETSIRIPDNAWIEETISDFMNTETTEGSISCLQKQTCPAYNIHIVKVKPAVEEPETLEIKPDVEEPDVLEIKPASRWTAFEHYLLPKKFSKEIEEALKKQQVTIKLRCKIVRIIADRCYENDATTAIVDLVANLAVQKWPALKSVFGHQSRAFAVAIRRRVSKLRSSALNKKQKEKNGDFPDTSVTDAYTIAEMKAEMLKEHPSSEKLKNLMTAIRSKRKKDAKSMLAEEHIKIYPALKLPELLLWEFCQLTAVSEQDMRNRWSVFLIKICKFLESTEDIFINSKSHENATLGLLNILPKLLISGKRTTGRNKNVIEVFEENTSEVLPEKTDAPRLIAIVNENASLMCYVGQELLFVTQSVITAVLLLISAYWVFDLEFPSEAKPSFLLISTVLLENANKLRVLQYSNSVQSILNQLQLYK